jgi:hypothetical protein
MKKKIFTKISFALFLLLTVFSQAQTVYPYLQAPTSNSIYISWKTSANAPPVVEFGTAAGTLTTSVNGTTQVLNDAGFPNNYFYHTVKLNKLTPNTIYYYKVTSGTFTSAVHSFKTLPLPGNAVTTDGHIRFLVMGDNELTENRFDTLMVRAKRKCEQKYSGAINENISAILMLGDQVNEGTLASYENVHFAKSKYLSPALPIQTCVGENETNGTLKLAAYHNLFYYDSLNYKGIYSGTENYYAYQVGNVLIINLSTEHVSNTQFSWLQQLVTAANADATVHWIISMGHRPYQAEQYVGDISPWIRNTVVPYLSGSSKYIMHLGGHHHLYARGQLKDNPVYNVISGGTAYNQFWAMSQEQDMDDVQKTIPNWAYNIIDVDVLNGKIDVETYSIGSAFALKNNVLIDQFHRYKNKAIPVQPSITSTFGDSLQLPYTITGSAFNSPAGELLNSTEFQISASKTFATLEKDYYRDYENLFGYVVKADSSADVNAGVNILNLDLAQWSIPNGKHYVRVRYRDRNLEWSPWSVTDSFKVVKSVGGVTTLATDKHAAELTDSVKVIYANGPGQAKDWIGLFKAGTVPSAGTTVQRAYTTGNSGSLIFKNIATAGQYYVAFFSNDTYTELTPRVPVFFGKIPVVTTDKTNYLVGDVVTVNYTNAPSLAKDWVGIYKVGTQLSGIDPNNWDYHSNINGTLKVANLGKGYYFASYFLEDGYMEPGARAYFTISEKTVDTISNLLLNKQVYKLGESINASWTDAPGSAKDALIMYTSGSTPGTSTPVSTIYTGSAANGTSIIKNGSLPQIPGNYFISLYTNDVFKEISNRVNFTVIDSVITTIHAFEGDANTIRIYPNPISKNGGAIIESEELIQKVEFMDIVGRVLFTSERVNSKTFPIMNLDLPTGIYYVRVYQENEKVKTGKIVINE